MEMRQKIRRHIFEAIADDSAETRSCCKSTETAKAVLEEILNEFNRTLSKYKQSTKNL